MHICVYMYNMCKYIFMRIQPMYMCVFKYIFIFMYLSIYVLEINMNEGIISHQAAIKRWHRDHFHLR